MLTPSQTALLLRLDADLRAGKTPRAPQRGTPDAVMLYQMRLIDIEDDRPIVLTSHGKKAVRLARHGRGD